jgi:Lrp/AsnC family leucine-responsive transcriptional regulator
MVESRVTRTPRPHRLTGTDRAILSALKENARQSISEIAIRLGVSRTTVKNRIDLMRTRNVIKRFTIELGDTDHSGVTPSNAFFLLQLKRRICRLIYESIRGWPELVQCWSLSGENDMLVQVRCSDNDGIERLRDRIVRHPEVAHAVTFMVLNEWLKRPSVEAVEGKPEDFMSKLLANATPIDVTEH